MRVSCLGSFFFRFLVGLLLCSGRGFALLRILDCDLCPLIWSCQSSANLLVRRSRKVILFVRLLCSSFAFQVLSAAILGVRLSAKMGRRASPDISGPPSGVRDVASVVGRRACLWVTVRPFQLIPLTLASSLM